MTKEEMREMTEKFAIEGARDDLLRVASLFEQYAVEIRRRAADIEARHEASLVTPSEEMRRAINEVENAVRNINFAQLAMHQATMVKAGL